VAVGILALVSAFAVFMIFNPAALAPRCGSTTSARSSSRSVHSSHRRESSVLERATPRRLEMDGCRHGILARRRVRLGLVRLVRRRPSLASVADVFYLLGVPLSVVGIVYLAAGRDEIRNHLRFVLDGIVIAGSLLFISWSTALGVVYRVGGGTLLSRVVDVAYP